MGKKNYNKQQRFLIDQIETLFKFVPPRQLKKTLDEVYGIYLQNIDSWDFKEIAMDMYLLNKFLESVEDGRPPAPLPKPGKP